MWRLTLLCAALSACGFSPPHPSQRLSEPATAIAPPSTRSKVKETPPPPVDARVLDKIDERLRSMEDRRMNLPEGEPK